MKKILAILLKILLPLILILLTMSFIIENIAVKTISNDIITKRIEGYMLDEIINKVDDDKLFEIAEKIENSKYIEKITQKYLDAISSNSYNTNYENIDITEEINLILEKDLENELPEDIKNNVINYMSEKSTELQNRLEIGLEEPVIEILNIYSVYTSFTFRISLIVLCIIDIIGLILLEKYNSLKSIQIAILITAILTICLFIAIKLLSPYIEQRLSGGWIDNINLNLMIGFIIVEIVVSIILFILGKKLNKKESENQ